MSAKKSLKYTLALVAIGVLLVSPLLLLITARFFVEARYIPSSAMQPALKVNDRILINKFDTFMKKPYERGEIILFYPPVIETGSPDMGGDIMHALGRLTGLSMFPNDPAFTKRVIGLPGEKVKIIAGDGVWINGKKLNESSYIDEAPNYSIEKLADIHGRNLSMRVIAPYARQEYAGKDIVVPADQLFVLGDMRNLSEDSHVWGMLKSDRVIGRAFMRIFPKSEPIVKPEY